MIDLMVVDLPAPLRPSRATTSPGLHRKRHIMQDVRAAIEGVEAFETSSIGRVSDICRAGTLALQDGCKVPPPR
jgi:hypothetical protein